MSRYLFLTQLYPSGLSGTSVKTRHTIEYLLSRGHSVDVVCIHHTTLIRSNDFRNDKLRIFVVPAEVMSSFSLIYIVKNIPLLFSRTPFRVKKLFSSQFLETAATVLESFEYSQVFFDGFAILQYGPLFVERMKQSHSLKEVRAFEKKCIYIDDEDITDLMKQRLIATNNLLLKLFFYLEFVKCGWYERLVFPYMAKIWAISDRTAKRYKLLVRCPVRVMPTIVSRRKNCFTTKGKMVVFTGLLSWLENTVGLEWFLQYVWPKVITALPKTKLIVVGQMAKPTFVQMLKSSPNVIYRGYVADLATVYTQAGVAIAPILTNCGIKVKTVTYLSYGLPVVSTIAATWGLKSLGGVVMAQTSQEFADQVIRILSDSRLRRQLSRDAIRNVYDNHSPRALSRFFARAGLQV